jgi:DNA invertase Pin-like site-specific DNA recombinase
MTLAYSYVRFSSKGQALGHSLERQRKNSAKYAAKHGLTLSEKSYEDFARSAFTSENLQADGMLRRFLDAVDSGQIAKGSFLLVENLDRVSRDQIMTALDTFRAIVDRGIVLVTVSDGHRYDTDGLNANPDLMSQVLDELKRANRESRIKSERVAEAWEDKRNNLDGANLTRNCPAWLIPKEDGVGFDLKPEAVRSVQRLFEIAALGFGQTTVHARLLQEGLVMPSGKPWNQQRVSQVMKDRRVLGELKLKGIEAPVKNYYPAIIDEDTFNRVQVDMAKRKASGGGGNRKGRKISNLLTGLAVCECGAPMHQYGAKDKYTYLRCATKLDTAGGACDSSSIPYHRAESALLHWILNVEEIGLLPAETPHDPRTAIDAEIAAVDAQIAKAVSFAMELPSLADEFKEKAAALKKKRIKLVAERDSYVPPRPIGPVLKHTQELLNKHAEMKATQPNSPELLALREQMRTGLRRLIDKVVFVKGVVEHTYPEPFVHDGFVDDPAVKLGMVQTVRHRYMHVTGELAKQSRLSDSEGLHFTADGSLRVEYELQPNGRFSRKALSPKS